MFYHVITEVEGVVMAITTHTDEKHGPCKVVVTANNNNDVLSGANKCVVFDLPHNLIKGKLTPDLILVNGANMCGV